MLLRSVLRFNKETSVRAIHTSAKGFVVPEGVEDVIKHLDDKKPTYTLLYFHADWNPKCEQMDKDYEKLVTQYANFHHVKVDCDATPKVKAFFDARVEPSFIVLVHGGEIHRMVGYNFTKIGLTLEKIMDLHQRDYSYFGNSAKSWERFYDEFDKFAKYGEYDRDAWRANYESVSDMHRGPGSI